MKTKKCRDCNKTKSVTEFSKRSSSEDGYQSYCKPCFSTYNKNLADGVSKNKKNDKPKTKAEQTVKNLIQEAIKRAKKNNIPYNIDKLDPSLIKLPAVCPILGIPLFKSEKRAADNSPSLDRIYPHKGYMIDNIHIISWKANRIKNDASTAELRKIVDYFEKIDSILNPGGQNAQQAS